MMQYFLAASFRVVHLLFAHAVFVCGKAASHYATFLSLAIVTVTQFLEDMGGRRRAKA